MASETQPSLRVVDLKSDDENKKFAPAGRMAATIVEIRNEQGGCLPQDLNAHGFTPAEVAEHWAMAQSLAVLENDFTTAKPKKKAGVK